MITDLLLFGVQVNETWLHIGSQSSAARLTIKQVSGSHAVGMARLMFNAEVQTKHAAAEGCPLIFNGRIGHRRDRHVATARAAFATRPDARATRRWR